MTPSSTGLVAAPRRLHYPCVLIDSCPFRAPVARLQVRVARRRKTSLTKSSAAISHDLQAQKSFSNPPGGSSPPMLTRQGTANLRSQNPHGGSSPPMLTRQGTSNLRSQNPHGGSSPPMLTRQGTSNLHSPMLARQGTAISPGDNMAALIADAAERGLSFGSKSPAGGRRGEATRGEAGTPHWVRASAWPGACL